MTNDSPYNDANSSANNGATTTSTDASAYW